MSDLYETDIVVWSEQRGEARSFRIQAADDLTPGMRQRIDVAVIYARALRALPDTVDGQPPRPVPEACPLTLEQLLSD